MSYKGYVALSELPQDASRANLEDGHRVFFDGLALPQGFRDDQVAINVDRIEQVLSVAGLSILAVLGKAGKKSEDTQSVTGINEDGSATGISSRFARKEKLSSEALIDYEQWLPPDLRKPAGGIVINTSERDERLKQMSHKYTRGQLDPAAHSLLLDNSIRSGLSNLAGQRPSKYNPIYIKGIAGIWAGFKVGDIALNHDTAQEIITSVGTLPAALLGISAVSAYFGTKIIDGVKMSDSHISCFYGYDRMVIAKGLARSSTFVKSTNSTR